jgi:hypothetical protein
MHGSALEVDVTSVRHRLASSPGNPTLTVVATLARAVAECPEVNARRAGRTRGGGSLSIVYSVSGNLIVLSAHKRPLVDSPG